MAFNFLGRIDSIEDFEEFEEFINKEVVYIDQRIAHFGVERQRYLELLDKFSVADLNLRSPYSKADIPDKNWLARPKQTPVIYKSTPDALNAEDVNLLKKMFLDSIKAKREKNEFKVKKIRDLLGQMQDEATFLTNEKVDYLKVLDKIRSKFSLPQFTEVQVSGKEPEPNTLRVEVAFGLVETATTKEYMVKAINVSNNSIVFERSAPSVKKGSTFILANGSNNGTKTVVGFLSANTMIVAEPLNPETPSSSLAVFQKV